MFQVTVPAKPAAVARGKRDPDATRLRWVERLQRYQTSGLTIAQFCESEDVSVPAFYQWKRQLLATHAASNRPLAFVPVRVSQPPTPLEVVLTTGAILRFPADCDVERVAAILRATGVIPC